VIATVAARIACRYAALMGLVISPVPIDLRFPPVTLAWPAHADKDAASVWLRDQIRAVFAQTVDWQTAKIAAQ
jgi:LysR family transcriptional activator of mexEF-oprN operon